MNNQYIDNDASEKMVKWLANNRHYSRRAIAIILKHETDSKKLVSFARTLTELFYHDNPYGHGEIAEMKHALITFWNKVS